MRIVKIKVKFRKIKVGERFFVGGHPYVRIRKTKDSDGDMVNAKSDCKGNYPMMEFFPWEWVRHDKEIF